MGSNLCAAAQSLAKVVIPRFSYSDFEALRDIMDTNTLVNLAHEVQDQLWVDKLNETYKYFQYIVGQDLDHLVQQPNSTVANLIVRGKKDCTVVGVMDLE
ncbi:hypothetical protein PENVUL_c023G05375 [Penicillium vulpinum]|uniref:Uncharacterized protein n=1 Tax=Penicillium vulpinum TaxID=29845 RepID=A0A1V6RUU8_9EURO|nr:hypothetical protein PENVUL_c023G05375 [Penicillium vulpinum]